jgi:hypothetical protein
VSRIKFNGLYQDLIKIISSFPKKPSTGKEGYLYIFQIDNRVKVGKTTNLLKRLEEHNRSSILYAGKDLQKITILGLFDNVHSAELEFHYILRDKYPVLSKEWFVGSYEEIISIGSTLKGITPEGSRFGRD